MSSLAKTTLWPSVKRDKDTLDKKPQMGGTSLNGHKRKLVVPSRSLHKRLIFGERDGSAPEGREETPGVMIKFDGKMEISDNRPIFCMKIIHEPSPSKSGVYQNSSPPSLLFRLSTSRLTRNNSRPLTPEFSDSGDSDNSNEDEESDGDEEEEPKGGREPSGRGRRRSPVDSRSVKKICSSCGTKKTPYWREGWEPSITLCNACGIRYHKYKKFCTSCIAIARKDEKGRLHCPGCLLRL